jgi:hypothetical protein
VTRGPVRRAALLLGCGASLLVAGCGSNSQATNAGLRVQREDLVVAAGALAGAEAGVERETKSARAAWPTIVNGLPARADPSARARIHEASMQAGELRVPTPFSEERARGLTGAASAIAGTYQSFDRLAARGWRLLDYSLAQLEGGPPAARSFAKSNTALYIESVYDAHFSLAQIGKHLLAGYEHLGGAAAFGTSLSQAEVEQLAGAYSEATLRLHPHVGVRLGS